MRLYAAGGVAAFPALDAQRNTLKQRLVELIGATLQSEVGFVPNTSRGVSEIALCLPWRRGDRVLLLLGEFPANITPWQQAAELFELELVYHRAEDFRSDVGLERLERELKAGLRLVAVSFVQFQTGLRMPIAEIGELCSRYGAELCVDAIQGLGAVPFDVNELHVDYMSCGGHKWLLGFEGAGLVYARESCAAKLRPYTAGWLSHDEPLGFLFQGEGHLRYDRPIRTDIQFVEGGTQNVLGYAALSASIPLLLQLGVNEIFEHVNAYLSLLEPELVARGFSSLRAAETRLRSTILCVTPPSGVDVLALHRALSAHGVICGVPDGKLRFAPHFANSFEEVPRVVSAIDAALAQRSAKPKIART